MKTAAGSADYSLSQDFSGGVEGRGIPGGRTRARLRVEPEALVILPDGALEIRLGWHEVRLSRGGASGRVIFCHAKGRELCAFSEEEAFLRALEGAGGNEIADELARLAGERVANRRMHKLLMLATLVITLLALRAIPRLFRATIDFSVARLPSDVDRELGRTVWENLDAGGKVLEDPELLDFLQMLVRRLEPTGNVLGMPLELRLIESTEANAFALPGGYLTVYTGLLREAEEPDQVAAVLAHEIAHVELRHGLTRIAHSIGIWAAVRLVFGDTSGLVGIARELFQLATMNDYSREQESAADLAAVQRLARARLDPLALARFFEKLEQRMGDMPAGLAWMSTHPLNRERIEAVQAAVGALGTKAEIEALEIDWQSLRARL